MKEATLYMENLQMQKKAAEIILETCQFFLCIQTLKSGKWEKLCDSYLGSDLSLTDLYIYTHTFLLLHYSKTTKIKSGIKQLYNKTLLCLWVQVKQSNTSGSRMRKLFVNC